jgi:hypothetical protein
MDAWIMSGYNDRVGRSPAPRQSVVGALMSRPTMLTRIACSAGVAICLATAAGATQAPAPDTAGTPPYVTRGDQVEATYTAYVERLERYQSRLRAHLEVDAPDLAERLTPVPPTPIDYGYQIVPELTVVEPAPPAAPRSGGYNWPWTNDMLDRQQTKLGAVEQLLDKVDGFTAQQRRDTYEQLIDGYDDLEAGQRQVDAHIKHNRFWQEVIAGDWPRFERQLVLHDAVVERERLLLELREEQLSEDARTSHWARIAQLGRQVEHGQPGPAAPAFIEITENTPQRKRLRVPLYTDIPDAAFVAASVDAIESIWSVDADGVEYRLEVDLRTTTAVEVYGPDTLPEPGAHLTLNDHVERFPTDGGVLTTGSNRTYAIPGRYVAVGPTPISNRTIAHEFGHILGFTDRYLRGARDLGRAGYNILEIVPDGLDLMAAPVSGFVRASHFDTLIAALTEATAP